MTTGSRPSVPEGLSPTPAVPGRQNQPKDNHSSEPHEHVWHVVYVDFDQPAASTEITCACGAVSFQ